MTIQTQTNKQPFMTSELHDLVIYSVGLKSNLTGFVITNKGNAMLTNNLTFMLGRETYSLKDFKLV